MSTPDTRLLRGDANNLFLQLNLEFLRIRSTKQLIYLLNNRLKSLLGYSYSTVFLMDSNRMTLSNYFSPVAENQLDPFSVSVKATISIEDDGTNSSLNQPVYIKSVEAYLKNQLDSEKWKALKLGLYDDEKLMGQWIMLYVENEMVTKDWLENLPGLAALIGGSLTNIIDYKAVLEREMENDIIQSLNIDFAAIREKNDLLKIVHSKLKNLFDFSDHFVAVINDDKLTLSSFLQDVGSWADEHPQYKQSVEAKYPLYDGIFNKVILSKEPHIFDLRQQYTRGNMPEYFQILYDSGIKKVVMIGLHVRDRMIGLWCICQIEDQCMTGDQLQLIKKISNQLSIAVENIKANEAIVTREEEGRLLLRLSEDIANIRNKIDLFNAINKNLKKLFRFEDIIIMVLNEDQAYRTFLFSLSHQSSGYTYYQKGALKKYIDDDSCLYKVMRSDGIVVFNMKQLYDDETAPDYIRFEYENGIREKIAIKLWDDQKNIGVFFVNSALPGSYTDHELELIEGVSYQLSIAVSNILASEEIANREEEKTILLDLSNEIALLKSRDDLFRVVNNQIKKIFSVNQLGIVKINEDRLTHSAFMIDLGETVNNPNDLEEVLNLKYSITDGVFSSIIASDNPIILDVKRLAGESGCPTYVKFWLKVGFQQLLCLALRVGGKPIGAILLNIDFHKIEFLKNNLLKAVCAQLAVAISNILANEQMAKREGERELLLSIGADLAAVRNHNELIDIFTKRLRSQLAFSHIFIGIVNDDQSTFSAFMTDPNSHSRGHPKYREAKSKWVINDGIMNRVCASPRPLVFDLDELSRKPKIPLYLKMNYESGLKQVVITRFLKGKRLFGFWAIFFDKKDFLDKAGFRLIAGLANLIAITVSNIMANEEMQRREKEKSMLLSFSNALAAVRNRKQLSVDFSKALQAFGVNGTYSLNLLTEDKKHHQIFLYDEKCNFTEHPDLSKILTTQFDINDGISNVVLKSEEPITFNIKELNKRKRISAYDEWWAKIDSIELTGIRVRLGEENMGILWLNIPDYDKVANAALLKNICSQLGIPLSNILVNEKIISRLDVIRHYKQQLEEEKIYLKEEIETTHNYSEIIGNSAEMQKIFRLVSKVAASEATVLILGETGTGKELIARAIHNNSPRKNRLMVKVNCAALPVNLIESELFGHERGSFTGATDRRIGKFELANKGTLFLDEIGELPLELQVKLLRVLQEKEVDRIGGKETIKVDVRIIAASNRDLAKETAEGRFRSDLYYRLNIFPISLPPLRSRVEDIPLLTAHFIKRFSKKHGKQIDKISNGELLELQHYSWPGNIRELEHLIERSILLTTGDTITSIPLPSPRPQETSRLSQEFFSLKTIDENERDHILNTLKYCKGKITGEGGAAQRLGVPNSTLSSKIKRLGIRKEHFK